MSSFMGSWHQAASITTIAIIFVAFLFELMSPIKSQIDRVQIRRGDLSLVHQSFFSWLDPIVDVAKSRKVVESDLCDLEDKLLSSNLSEDYKRIAEKHTSIDSSLVKYLYASKPTETILTVLCQFGHILTKTSTPLLLQKFLEAPSIQHLLVLFCLRLMGSFLKNHSSFYATILATSFKATFTGEIYNVVFQLSKNTRRKEEAPISLVEADIQRVVDWIVDINDIWAAPLAASLSIGVLVTVIGPMNTAISLIALIVIYPFLQVLGTLMQRTIGNLMERKDIRTQTVTETISKAKTIKIYGWESAFEQRIHHARQDELNSMKVLALVQGLISGIMSLCPQLMASFALFSMWISRGCLTTSCVFPILGLFTILDNSLSTVSASLFGYLSAKTSFRRIQTFILSSENLNSHRSEPTSHGSPSILMRSVSLCSSDGGATKFFLKHIHVDLMGPQLVTLAGSVGSGKTAILDTVAGDLTPQEGIITVNGIMACQSQIPWVMSGSIRENIIFGKEYDPDWYQEVIFACALREDLGILPRGDATIVSPSATNLSGGQKSRITLARAIYSKANILLLDDPLTSIDVNLRQHIIEHVLGPQGIAKNALKIVSTSSSELNKIAHWNLLITDDKKLQMTKPLTYWESENQEASLQESFPLCEKGLSQNCLPRGTHPSSFQDIAVQTPQASPTHEEDGTVPFSVYRQWLSLCHPLGWAVVILCIVCGRLVQLYSTYSLTRLSEASHENQLAHLYTFLASNLLQAFCTMGFIAAAWFLCLLPTACRLHQQLVAGCLNSPIQFFADTTTGQILNRFTNDILKADGPIASYIIVVIITGSITCMITCLLLFTAPKSSPGILVIGYVFFRLQKRYRSTARDIRRIELETRDPLITSLQDAWVGASSIKLFRMDDILVRQFRHKINRNSQSFFIRTCLEQWVDLRLEILTQ
ncbi:hypothetical protein N7493_006757 [Penicillium malachiteum]|uniref:Uncharacterized protein n=1 Tax=Penicillium malachiteum TaxID=1324776 RepID=A0AAD6HJD1_9EURO|nr:hypothetical protein N7493_006757 [Penicillium malachiteum]